ncbi:MAG: glycoside hydrolase family 36 protein [Planctomycetota bacterium]|jgi:alpha-galactosidase
MGGAGRAPRLDWYDRDSISFGLIFEDGEEALSTAYPETRLATDGDIRRFSCDAGGDLPGLLLSARATEDGAREFSLEMEGAAPTRRSVRRLVVIEADVTEWLGNRDDVWMFRHGTTSPGDPDICVPLREGIAETLDLYGRFFKRDAGVEVYLAEGAAIFRNTATGAGGLFGFVTLERQATRIELHCRGGRLFIRALSDVWYAKPGAGERIVSEALRVETSGDDNLLLRRWVDRLVELAPRKPRVPAAIPTGWSDWQYYRREITQEDVLENVAALEEGRYPLDYVVVDDGFQARMSDWLEPNERFPLGIAEVGKRITAAGFKPGVWLAPFTAAEGSRLAAEHSEWLLKSAGGAQPNWHKSHMGRVCAIDYSRDAPFEWLEALIRTFREEYGFEWIKLDGPIIRYYEGGRFAKSGLTQVGVVRRALEVIRRAAGGAIVEGEGYYGPAIGLVDVQRVTQDIQTEWPRLRLCAQSNCLSGHFHRRLWVNNPETFILRDVGTPHYEPEVALAPETLELEITALALSGGAAILADPINVLSDERKRLLQTFLPPYGIAALPQRLFTGEPCPSVYGLTVERPFGSWEVIAVYNWGEETREIEVALPEADRHVFDFWRRRYLGVHKRQIALDVAPHGVRLISARPISGRPIEIVGTCVHVTQGGVELADVSESDGGARLSFDVTAPYAAGEAVFLKAKGEPAAVSEGVRVVAGGGGIYAVEVSRTGTSHVAVALRQ